jgi:hypothetical protein
MTVKTTSRTSWVFVEKWYGGGVIRVKNRGSSPLRVQFRSVTNTTRTVEPLRCTEYSIAPYTEVFFKSPNGDSVTIDSGGGRCLLNLQEEQQAGLFSEDTVSPDLRIECIQKAEDIRNGVFESDLDVE